MARRPTPKSQTKPRSTAKAPAKGGSKGSRSRSSRSPARPHGNAPGRAVWTGQIRLSLVSVPVSLYPATESGAKLSFHQVHAPSGKRIRYEKVVPGMGPVETDDIVKGYEVESGRYVLLDDEEIDRVKVEARKTLDLVQFVDHCEIDPIYFERPYYVVPDGELAEEAYQVLRDSLRATGKMGLGQFVMRGREYIAALKPCGRGLLLETLRFSDEVRKAAPYFSDLEDQRPEAELTELAEELIRRKTKPFDAKLFRDSYTDALRALVDAKLKHRKVVDVEDEKPEGHGGKVVDLVEALKRSVARAEKGEAAPGASKPARGGTARRKAS